MTDQDEMIGFRIPLTRQELEDLKEWAKEHNTSLTMLIRKVVFDAAAA